MTTKLIVLSVAGIGLLAVLLGLTWYINRPEAPAVTDYASCVSAGNPVMESYPPQCRTPDGRIFTQDIGNELDKSELIRATSPRPNETVSNSITITGEARGSWFFEGSFPLHLEDLAGRRLATTIAQAEGEWMTTEFVPFRTTLPLPTNFTGPAVLVLEKDNPSGLPEHNDSLRIPLTVAPPTSGSPAPSVDEMMQVKVFFGNSQLLAAGQDECTTTFPVLRSVPKTPAVARTALEQLLAGPTDEETSQGYHTSINPGVTIQNLTITDGVATVDFTAELERALGGSCRVTAIRHQITETVRQFPTVDEVIISIDGRTEDILQP